MANIQCIFKNVINLRNFLYVAMLIALASCSKSQVIVTPVTGHNTNTGSYLPVTKGSYWEYAYTQNGITDTATTTMTGLVTSYDDVNYYEASTSFKRRNFPDATCYLSADDHVYKMLSISKTDTSNLYFFNDTTALNNTWMAKVNNSGIINGQPARYAGGIVEQNINLTVEGKTYTGVTHSKIYLQYYLGNNNYTTAETYDFFIVKGIGPIEIFTSTGAGITGSQSLIAYAIK